MSTGVSEANIDEFCNITGASRSVAASLLSACNGSLEMAINMHMEGIDVPNEEASGSSSSQAGSSAGLSGSRKRKHEAASVDVFDDDDDDDVRAPIPQKRETLVEPGYEGYSIRPSASNRGRVRSVFDGFRNFGNEARSYGEEPRGGRGKKKTLEELFKPPLDIMYKGDWQSVRDSASAAKKWLIVNIQDAGEFQCQILNRDVWSSDAVRTIIGEHFIFWQQYKELEEAQRYMTFYPVDEWPHIAILDPRTGERLVTWSRVPDAATFCDLITEFLTLHPVFDTQAAASSSKKRQNSDEEEVSIVDASEDDQLAAAIQASLAESTKPSKPSSHRYDDVDDDSDSDIALTTEDEDSNLCPPPTAKTSSTVSNGSTATTSSTISTPTKSHPSVENGNGVVVVEKEPSKNSKTGPAQNGSSSSWTDYLGDADSEKSSLIIRFPDGRKDKKDIPCSSKFMAIIKFVVSEGYPLESYEIVTNFPRKVLSDLDENQTLKEMGLFPRETIFVQHRM